MKVSIETTVPDKKTYSIDEIIQLPGIYKSSAHDGYAITTSLQDIWLDPRTGQIQVLIPSSWAHVRFTKAQEKIILEND